MSHTVIFYSYFYVKLKFHFGEDDYNNTKELYISGYIWDGWFPLPRYFLCLQYNNTLIEKWRNGEKYTNMKLWQMVFIKDDRETLSVLKIKYMLYLVNSNKGFPMLLPL